MHSSLSSVKTKLMRNWKRQKESVLRKEQNRANRTVKNSLNQQKKEEEPNHEEIEEELNQILYKDDFQRMRVIGQFNKGFLICVHKEDLYILDQHACDEKYNYESICSHAEIRTQPLFVYVDTSLRTICRPVELNLTPSDLQLVENYMYIFNYNGFRIDLKNTTKLVAVPSIKSLVLGVQGMNRTRDLIE